MSARTAWDPLAGPKGSAAARRRAASGRVAAGDNPFGPKARGALHALARHKPLCTPVTWDANRQSLVRSGRAMYGVTRALRSFFVEAQPRALRGTDRLVGGGSSSKWTGMRVDDELADYVSLVKRQRWTEALQLRQTRRCGTKDEAGSEDEDETKDDGEEERAQTACPCMLLTDRAVPRRISSPWPDVPAHYHAWTKELLLDIARKGLQLLASQYPVHDPGAACYATRADVLVRNVRTGHIYLLEIKTGYDASLHAGPVGGTGRLSLLPDVPRTTLNEHYLQAAYAMHALNAAAGDAGPVIKTAAVLVVNARTERAGHTGRAPDGSSIAWHWLPNWARVTHAGLILAALRPSPGPNPSDADDE